MRSIGAFATVAALMLATGVAHAATAEVSGGVLIYVAGPSDSTLNLEGPACYSPFPGPCPPDRFLVRILDFGGVVGRPGGEAITPGDGCAYGVDIFGPPAPGQPPPPWPADREVYCSGVDSFNVSLGAGADWLFASTGLAGAYFGGDGDDRFQ
ncbi:MAG: hypothetical protein ACJ744_06085, partial [Gaiellaceae bacterium]